MPLSERVFLDLLMYSRRIFAALDSRMDEVGKKARDAKTRARLEKVGKKGKAPKNICSKEPPTQKPGVYSRREKKGAKGFKGKFYSMQKKTRIFGSSFQQTTSLFRRFVAATLMVKFKHEMCDGCKVGWGSSTTLGWITRPKKFSRNLLCV